METGASPKQRRHADLPAQETMFAEEGAAHSLIKSRPGRAASADSAGGFQTAHSLSAAGRGIGDMLKWCKQGATLVQCKDQCALLAFVLCHRVSKLKVYPARWQE